MSDEEKDTESTNADDSAKKVLQEKEEGSGDKQGLQNSKQPALVENQNETITVNDSLQTKENLGLSREKGAKRSSEVRTPQGKERPKGRRLQNDSDSDSSSPEERTKKSKGMGKIPQIPEFGNYPPTEQFREWREYIDLFYDAVSFAPEWNEAQTMAYFRVVCGANMRRMIIAYGLAPVNSQRPFTRLIRNIDEFLEGLSDPALEQQALQNCKQKAGESASEFYIRLVQLVRHRSVDHEFLRTHYITNLLDADFRNFAIVNRWDLLQTVAAATRSEAAKKANPMSHREMGEVAAVSMNRGGRSIRGRENRKSEGSGPSFSGARASASRPGGRGPACKNCGNATHANGSCPAIGRDCHKCGGSGHFARVCQGQKRHQGSSGVVAKNVDQVNENEWSDM